MSKVFEDGPMLAWRLVIGGGDPDSGPNPRYVVLAPTADEAVYLFKRRGVTGIKKQGVMRWPDLDPPRDHAGQTGRRED